MPHDYQEQEVPNFRFWDEKANTFRPTGCLRPRPAALIEQLWPVWGTTPDTPLIPVSEWVDVDNDDALPPRLNQGSQSSCSICATTGAMRARARQQGRPDVELSVADIYSRINGGRDSGASLEDALAAAMEGICSIQYADPWNWQRPSRKSGFEQDRQRTQIKEAWFAPTIQAFGSGIQRGYVGVFGIFVTRDYTPDSQGMLPPYRGGRGGGHALYAASMKKINGIWNYHQVGSWGADWGDNGMAWMPESWLQTRTFAAWLIRQISWPADLVPPAPKP